MALPPVFERLKLPVIGAPMFIAGNPKLVIEPVAEVVAQLAAEYTAARRRLALS